MKLSYLQKYILKQTLLSNKNKVPRNIFADFYGHHKNPPSQLMQTKIITKSIERLIEKGLLIGFGEKTQHKLFLTQIKFTAKGKKLSLHLLGQQAQLPFGQKNK
jgi:hypothetical protein